MGPDPAIAALKLEIMEMILWNEREAPRSKQVSIGPSELGTPCDRRLAYRLADIPPVNFTDPWPAIVGTSIHDWLETAVNRFQQANGDRGWVTELPVYPDELVKGRSDVYNSRHKLVTDWKTAGPDVMRKVRKGVIPEGYIRQVQVYGLGHTMAGRPVEWVSLVFLPRSGWLDDMFVWRMPYEEQVARDTVARMYEIGNRLLDMDIRANPHRFQLIDATPGDACVFCAYWVRDGDPEIAASDKGCPGR